MNLYCSCILRAKIVYSFQSPMAPQLAVSRFQSRAGYVPLTVAIAVILSLSRLPCLRLRCFPGGGGRQDRAVAASPSEPGAAARRLAETPQRPRQHHDRPLRDVGAATFNLPPAYGAAICNLPPAYGAAICDTLRTRGAER